MDRASSLAGVRWPALRLPEGLFASPLAALSITLLVPVILLFG